MTLVCHLTSSLLFSSGVTYDLTASFGGHDLFSAAGRPHSISSYPALGTSSLTRGFMLGTTYDLSVPSLLFRGCWDFQICLSFGLAMEATWGADAFLEPVTEGQSLHSSFTRWYAATGSLLFGLPVDVVWGRMKLELPTLLTHPAIDPSILSIPPATCLTSKFSSPEPLPLSAESTASRAVVSAGFPPTRVPLFRTKRLVSLAVRGRSGPWFGFSCGRSLISALPATRAASSVVKSASTWAGTSVYPKSSRCLRTCSIVTLRG
eukprot:CAMPEP_0169453758 /NCGR_PEP_ID=MMETSP1042-20121227/14923_1 /TAXON_ID=464988 /ORGANISM="Hemiselmis andersenii, Strain CCMP1180" /LENGTH=262 /DNA_ID=CAMNT_0009565801 /DNA_START=11 /DNA_END=795 /DNA_ORIENTATION=-